ncbi:MAG: hypothetical protein R3F20_19545 [Planctomycetota bacterium]
MSRCHPSPLLLLLLTLAACGRESPRATTKVDRLEPGDPKAVYFTVLAAPGDRFGDVAFDRRRFDQERLAGLESGRTHEETRSVGPYRFHFTDPYPGRGESEEEFRARLQQLRAERAADPGSGQGEWLVDPEVLGREHGFRPFLADAFSDALGTRDGMGHRAVTLAVRPDRRSELESFTSLYLGRSLVLVVEDEILMLATLQGSLRDEIQLVKVGGYSSDEIDRIFRALGKSR